MIKHILAIAAFLILFSPDAEAQLVTGDVAIVGFSSDTVPSPRRFAFVVLTNIDEGTKISFTDKGWLAGGDFRATEGLVSYTAPAGGIVAGTVIDMMGEAGGFALSTAGDQLFAFQGSIGETGLLTGTLLYGFHDNGFGWDADATSTSTSSLPPALANANVAMIPELDNCAYTGPTIGSSGELLAFINDPANWIGDNTVQLAFPTVFSVVAPTGVPAPVWEGIVHLEASPNPFNPKTTIAFELATQEEVRLLVFDIGGRLVATLLDGVVRPAGRTEVRWGGQDDNGRRVASGTYFYRLEAGEYEETKGMVMVK